MVKLHYSEEDGIQYLISKLRQTLTELFLVSEVKQIKVTKSNIQHYKHVKGIKPGDTVSAVVLRQYRDESDFTALYSVRLNEEMKTRDASEKYFISDELAIMEDYLDHVLKYDFNNEWKSVIRRYIDFLKEKQNQISKPQNPKENKQRPLPVKMILKQGSCELILSTLKPYFEEAEHSSLTDLLNGIPIDKPLNFLGKPSQLPGLWGSIYRDPLKYCSSLGPTTIQKWICKNFLCNGAPFSANTVKKSFANPPYNKIASEIFGN
jgi:hypothetical protein